LTIGRQNVLSPFEIGRGKKMQYETAKFIIGTAFFVVAGFELASGRFLFRQLSSKKDVILDVAGTLIVPALVLPTVLWLSSTICAHILPNHRDAWSSLPWWAMFGILLLADDLTQYLWHRLSHASWLYPLHRAHHSAHYLSVRVVYRNNLIYYALMPGLWFSGMLIYLGFMSVYPSYVVIKMLVIMGAHSSVSWDTRLLQVPAIRPFMWILTRVISTPTTHAAHHGLHEADEDTHYRGNYGNLLFLWDILFGTAKITGRRPSSFGIEGLKPVPWYRELLWPARTQREP
jgi:sterol desaturase/sphingolipid hydroxylase (fatty acid hydroxylase superfamily)